MTPVTAGDPVSILSERFSSAMKVALGDALPDGADPLLGPSRNPEFGDFQSNCAMPLAKRLGQSPRELAQKIIEALEIDDIAEPAAIAGPGFINVRLKADALAAALDALDTPMLGIEPPEASDRQTVVVDVCGVNLAKQMHVGHLRATVIGDAIARLWERLGHEVFRQNHFGDWGLPIAMVTAEVKRQSEAGALDLANLNLEDLERHYRFAQSECDADEKGLEAVNRFDLGPKAQAELQEQVFGARVAMDEAKRALVALQSHDPAYVRVWEAISRITLESCFETCRRLHANVTAEATAGESTYAEELAPLVQDLIDRGVVQENDGALILDLKDQGIKQPFIVRKRDGGFLYSTSDMASIRRRVQKLGGTRLIYAVDARQALHFKSAFAGARKAGYATTLDGREAELYHAAFGTVLGEDNRPFKTRSGDNVRLSDLLDEAVARAERAVSEKNPDLPPDERKKVAEAVGIGAIKYADLSSDRIKDYVFSFDRMLAFEGNTGPYLQYALVRVRSILRKAREKHDIDVDRLASADAPPFVIGEPDEKTLALELLKFPGVGRSAAEASEPHRLCGYLFDLSGAFNAFFTTCPVLQAPDEATRWARLRLVRLTGEVLRDGLETLGILPLDRM
jgi:arginyl-tRNA synthetase